jgi:hypothetical protein
MAFPSTPLAVEVSIALDADLSDPDSWSWTDITSYALHRDLITIVRGRADEQTQTEPSECALTLRNNDGAGNGGIFSPRNPTGPYYGRFGRNTPLRIRVNAGSGLATRFTGFVTTWPPRWDASGRDQWVPIVASGVLRRVAQGKTPLRSPMTRLLLRDDVGTRALPYWVAYWPCEDGASAANAADVLGGAPLIPTGTVDFGNAEIVPAGISAAPYMAGGSLSAAVSGHSEAWGTTSPVAGVRFSAAVVASGVRIFSWTTSEGMGWYLTSAVGQVNLVRADTGATVASAAIDVTGGDWHDYSASTYQGGADITVSLTVDTTQGSGTVLSMTAGLVTSINANPLRSANVTSIAEIAVTDVVLDFTDPATLGGNDGDFAAPRFGNLCSVAGIAADYTDIDVDGAVFSYQMGVQHAQTLMDALRECEAAAVGVMFEKTDAKLRLDVLSDRENLTPSLVLDYAAGHLSPPLEPVDDDQRIRNDVTITRRNGSDGHYEDSTSPLGTDPLTGVGRYDSSATINLYLDSQPRDYAAQQVNVGTVDETRYPRIHLNLAANPDLIDDWTTADIGHRITIDNPPEDIPPDQIDVIIEGYAEVIGFYDWDVDLACAPYRPYKTFVLAEDSGDTDEFLGRLVPDSLELVKATTSGATSLVVASAPAFTTAADDYPLLARAAGEDLTVTACSVVTPSFVAAGTAAHGDNATLNPALPAGLAEGDLLLILAAIRSSGTGTPVTPAGFDVLLDGSNMCLYGKRATASESTPSITFAGGAAGDTTSAQTAAFRGVSADVLYAFSQLNGSAANIAYPQLSVRDVSDDLGNRVDNALVLVVGWKQDDWTSVATLAGMTEIGEPSSTTGSDQGLVWDYLQQTTAANVASGSFVVTGGTSQISRGGIVALRSDLFTWTVTRSANGVVKAQAQGADIEIREPAVLQL